ncbi:MAG: sporulation transcription factor Spo0A [Clostridia bacterium]|nr:sporulation transcription factor Spo0A [Clostridiales bacterium]MBQ6716283.1 sporulation transcription factor Spo0A [Clostridia bacterium]
MDKISVLIVDDNQTLVRLMVDFLSRKQDIEIVGTARDGVEAVEQASSLVPDVVLLDIVMPRMDGFGALEALNKMNLGKKPHVIMVTGLTRDDFIARAMSMGADYYMIKPFDMHALYTRIREVALQNDMTAYAGEEMVLPAGESTIDEKVTNIFLSIGIPAHIKGYAYLREAVRMVVEDHDVINRITKELYPGIARRFSTTSSKVERAMRHAIEVAWSRGRLDSVNRIYGYKVFSADDKPTNGEFIALIADKVAIKQSA